MCDEATALKLAPDQRRVDLRQQLSATRSWSFCTGACCTPGSRNRTCAIGDVFYRPPHHLYFIGDGNRTVVDDLKESVGCYLHNRFAGGRYTAEEHALFAPKLITPAALEALLVRSDRSTSAVPVIEQPILLTADIHNNIGHLMLDSVFPIFASAIRLRGAALAELESEAPSRRNKRRRSKAFLERVLAAVPDMTDTSPTFQKALLLLYDPPTLFLDDKFMNQVWTMPKWMSPLKQPWAHWHRGRAERLWAEAVMGHTADLAQLSAACPRGCLLRSVSYGVGTIGLSTVTKHNAMGGTREYRASYMFRQRVQRAFKTAPLPLPPSSAAVVAGAGAGGASSLPRQFVTFVSSRRQSATTVGGLTELVRAVKALPGYETTTHFVQWETMTFFERAQRLAHTTVLVTGVGTASMSAFLVPQGAVVLCFGWRQLEAKKRIMYFDSHILHGLEHARVLYYPSYDQNELVDKARDGARQVQLNLSKATAFVESGMALQVKGFDVPVSESVNANWYDDAYAELVRRTNGAVHDIRNNDYDFGNARWKPSPKCMGTNGVNELLWGPKALTCPWSPAVPQLLRDLDL